MASQTLEDQRHATYEIAEAIAPGWERQREFVEQVSGPVREWLVRELRPEAGDTILELAAGAGDTGYDALAAAGDGAHLLSTDFSPAMLAVARRRGAERRVENVEHRQIDAERIDLPEDSVDGVLCRFGYMLMADPSQALSETRRVLRPRGRVALAVWGPPERSPFLATAAMALVRNGHLPPPKPDDAGPFSMGSAAIIRSLLEQAGFDDVRVEEVEVGARFRDVDEYLTVTADTAGPIALALRALSRDDREAVKEDVERAVQDFTVEEGILLPGLTLCAVASAS
jgi:ubiquinone/menaquinone biosynthesis C-methylase UbiE